MCYYQTGLSGACTARLGPNQSVAGEANNFWLSSERMNMAENISAPEKVQVSFRQLSASAASLNTISDELRESITELETPLEKLDLAGSAWVQLAGGHDDSVLDYCTRDLGYTQ